MMKRLLFLVIATLLINGEMAFAQSWKLISKPLVVSEDKSFSVELPVGWVRSMDKKNMIVATRDGMGIQLVMASRMLHKDAFKKFKTKEQKKRDAKKLPDKRSTMINANTLPSELAELVIAEMKSVSEMSHVRVISNLPSVIDGHPGFRLHFQYKNAKGLQFDHIICGFVNEKNLYRFAFRAPSKIYFPRDLKVFDRMLASFKVGKGKNS